MARTYLFFLLLAGILSAMVPSGRSTNSVPPAEKPARLDSEPASSSSNSAPSPWGEIALRRENDGHFYADVQINGSPIRALVDTGASGIALSRDDARRAGLAISAGMFEVVGKGADGDVHGEFVRLDRVSLGPKTVEGAPAVVLDAGEQSLLGRASKQVRPVEIRGDTMFLR